ncbi:predicted protein [Streptomyces viridosporus ATCC 14672]|uniref:Predicted protein n=1 Tax=Streptomyces viridosporus (strain ATCC 14672 / DSM 40746 / JCM 4963 / KCTC 9882 / NRRL B-12104 / FH 1290) TaxID=566461 RepID=D5ZXH2_STRV1|nr:hypothetical protein [Streptomyces viridosporus]EFE67105.1 predicted protein [Streptomyces viridosporus ATCC 14672]
MAPEPVSTPAETRVRLKDGGSAVLTLADVAVAALHTPEDDKYDVLAVVGGKNVPALVLVRNALKGRDPWNTNVAEMALHDLGFSILVRRRFDNDTGEPVRLTREQINNSSL